LFSRSRSSNVAFRVSGTLNTGSIPVRRASPCPGETPQRHAPRTAQLSSKFLVGFSSRGQRVHRAVTGDGGQDSIKIWMRDICRKKSAGATLQWQELRCRSRVNRGESDFSLRRQPFDPRSEDIAKRCFRNLCRDRHGRGAQLGEALTNLQ